MKAFLALLVIAGATFGLYQYWYLPEMTPKGESEKAALAVDGLGKVLQMVYVVGDADATRLAMSEYYAPYVDPVLLAEWKDDQASAPGRRAASPWPVRIELDTIADNGDARYIVRGRIIEITSKELVEGGAAREQAIVATVSRYDDGWRISSFERE